MEASLPKKRLIKKLVVSTTSEPEQPVSLDTVSKSPDFFPTSPVYCPKSPDFPPPSPYELPPPSPDYSKMSQLELQQFEQPQVQYRPKSPDYPPPPRSITPDVSAEKQSRVDAFIQKYKRVEQPRREDSRHHQDARRDDDFRRKSNQSEADFHKKSPSPEREISRGNDGARRQPGKNEADRRSQSRSDTIPDHMRGGNRIDTMNQYNGRSAYHEKYQFKPTVTKQQLDKELEEYGKK